MSYPQAYKAHLDRKKKCSARKKQRRKSSRQIIAMDLPVPKQVWIDAMSASFIEEC